MTSLTERAALFLLHIRLAHLGALSIHQPFLPADAMVQELFPDRIWAVRAPSLILVVGLGSVGIFIGLTIRGDVGSEADPAYARPVSHRARANDVRQDPSELENGSVRSGSRRNRRPDQARRRETEAGQSQS
ncbi:uncharacterized protein PSFLO_06124 [Pseudozyma flocculosa]|uniref:Dolichol phosphate-mannose biosynthesis regulatory protein n=1 Tax=Pseudozyma flocculosa TaxID=84751 RepID=A0A5C3F8E2_9BASI|nr:uncharacterized protein PSFLO_06124 [Pseudozyma flocculosa]